MQSARDPVRFRPYQPATQPPYDAPAYGSTHKRYPQESLVPLPHTITETTGPRFSPAQFPPIADLSVVNGKAALGERIIVHGRITDEDGRCRTDERGEFHFTTVRPGPVPGRGNTQQAPHFAITLHARGLLRGLVPVPISPASRSTRPTRCYHRSTIQRAAPR